MTLAPEEVGERIRQARLAKGWTHERLAREIGVGLRTVQSQLDAGSVASLAERLEAVERSAAENQAMLAELLEIARAGSRPSIGESG